MVRVRSLFALPVLVALGCAETTQQARRVETSGFLGDYSQLEKGQPGEALLIYISPEADFSTYDKILVDDVTVWRAAESDLANLPKEEIEMLAVTLNNAMVENLREDYQIVRTAGPGTLRLRLAITEAAKSWVVMDTLSTVILHSRLISGIKKLATGTHTYVGEASIEGELLDAVSGKRLAAAVDRRSGGKSFRGAMSAWSDVQEACRYWARRLRDRLRNLRGQVTEAGGE